MMFVIQGFDGPGVAGLRAAHQEAHVAHLLALGERFVLGGPFVDENTIPVGSMMVIEAADRAAAEAFAAADSFVLNKVFAGVEIHRWAFGHLRSTGRG